MGKQNRWMYLGIIFAIVATLFFVSNEKLKGYLRSEINFAKEIKSPVDSMGEYRIASQAPFKYRLLFPAIVKGSYNLISDGNDSMDFFYVYKFWSFFFYVVSALAMFFLLESIGFTDKYSFSGALIFVLLPPMLVAFTLPVHTREDTLAYSLFFAGLICLVRDKKAMFLVVALLGALTRETLLLLPLLYLFFAVDSNIIRRFFIAGLPVLLWLSIRVTMGHEEYDVWEGLKWNLANPEQVVGFLLITFNVCWIPFIMHLLFYKQNIQSSPPNFAFFYRTALFTLVVILVTTFVGGIYNEIRLLYLFAPWIIVIFLDFVKNNRATFQTVIIRKAFWLYVLASIIICGVMLYLVLSNRERLITPGKYAVPYVQWIIMSVFYIFLMLLFLPLSWKVFALKRSVK